ncbi:MAG: hypothetical protein KA526_09180 [Chitinophagales bacterium]|nr:hypothetical protein [Chitinophagales bacterium]
MSFVLAYSWWFILLCMAIGVVYAYLLYGNKKFIFTENENKWWKYSLASLRFLSTTLIAFLLLSLLIKSIKTEAEKPLLIILQDNSSSLKTSFGNFPKQDYLNNIQTLEKELAQQYNLVHYNFGATLQEQVLTNFTENETDISQAIDEAFIRHGAQNIGAIILASDGIFTKGNSPLYNKNTLRVPFYTIALGDTTIRKDAFIKSVHYPELVYLGDQFNINIQIEANRLKGQNSVLEVIDPKGNIIQSKIISISDEHFLFQSDVVGNADKPGILPYKIRLKKIDGETILENNLDVAYIEVIDGRQKITLLYDAPHPDIKAFKNAIEQNKNYQLEQNSIATYSGNFKESNLVILHGLPSMSSATYLQKIQAILTSNIPILWIVSANTNLAQFNFLQKNIQINGTAQNGNDVHPIYQNTFSKFTISPVTIKILSDLPPLLAPYGKYEMASTTSILFTQQIGNIPTNNPLFVFNEINGNKTGIICGEGLWRWRMHEFYQFKNYNATDDLINKCVQYLTVKGDKRRFKVHTPKNVYNSNETIQIDAELYNESFELVNDVDASCVVKGDNGKEYSFTFDKTMNAYSLNVGILPVGNYKVHATTNYKGKGNAAACSFTVRAVLVEALNLQANHTLLNIMAVQSGGKMYFPNNLQSIGIDIEKNNKVKTILFDAISTKPLIDFKWWFFIILLLLISEWFIRKYNGNI